MARVPSFCLNCIVNRMARYLWLHYALVRTTRRGTGRTLGFTSCVCLHWPSRSGNMAFLSSGHKGTHHGLSERWEGPVQESVLFSCSWVSLGRGENPCSSHACALCGSGNPTRGQEWSNCLLEFYKDALGPGLCPLWNRSKLRLSFEVTGSSTWTSSVTAKMSNWSQMF